MIKCDHIRAAPDRGSALVDTEWTATITAGTTVIKAAPIIDLRNGVK